MSEFGYLLRSHRNVARDPLRHNRPLTLERFVEALEEKTGLQYTRTALSDWERGRSQISSDNRLLLVGLIQVLHAHKGLSSLDEADELLAAGHYRALDKAEGAQVSPDWMIDSPSVQDFELPPNRTWRIAVGFLAQLMLPPPALWQGVTTGPLADAPPDRTDLAMHFINNALTKWDAPRIVRLVVWTVVCFCVQWYIIPLLQWSSGVKSLAPSMYIVSSTILPTVIGFICWTNGRKRWQPLNLGRSWARYLLTLTGAATGFHLSFAVAIALSLLIYHAGLGALREPFFMWIVTVFVVAMSRIAAYQLPRNIWRVSGKLQFALKNAAALLVVFSLGVLIGLFVWYFYPLLVNPHLGSVLAVMTIAVVWWLCSMVGEAL